MHIDEDLLRQIDALNIGDNLEALEDWGYWKGYSLDNFPVYRRATENDKAYDHGAKVDVQIAAIDESVPYTLVAKYYRTKYAGHTVCRTYFIHMNNGVYIYIMDWDSDGTPKTIEAELQRIIDVFGEINGNSN